ncbi:MAG: hypothetical protein AAF614_17455 [Chloroflexota bacterium]
MYNYGTANTMPLPEKIYAYTEQREAFKSYWPAIIKANRAIFLDEHLLNYLGGITGKSQATERATGFHETYAALNLFSAYGYGVMVENYYTNRSKFWRPMFEKIVGPQLLDLWQNDWGRKPLPDLLAFCQQRKIFRFVECKYIKSEGTVEKPTASQTELNSLMKAAGFPVHPLYIQHIEARLSEE